MAATLEELTSTNEELSDSIKQLAHSREYIRTIIEQAPVGIAMLKGPDHIIEIANPAILSIWGRKESELVGFPHEEARPELQGQPVNKWLREVYNSGKPKINNEFTVRLRHNDGLREAIVNSIYQPIFSEGTISGVLIILEEITQQVLERRKVRMISKCLLLPLTPEHLPLSIINPQPTSFPGIPYLIIGLDCHQKKI